jgi:uncharacterized protein YndB with AHSA1/START domain
MSEAATPAKSIVVERTMPHPPEKVWRALTEAGLVSEWLMKTDLEPVVGHRFNFRSEPVNGWNGVTDCEVLVAEPPARLVYSWNAHGEQAVTGIKSIVTWVLTPTDGGTHLRMEHAGFGPNDEGFYKGASYGWPLMIEALERVAGELN